MGLASEAWTPYEPSFGECSYGFFGELSECRYRGCQQLISSTSDHWDAGRARSTVGLVDAIHFDSTLGKTRSAVKEVQVTVSNSASMTAFRWRAGFEGCVQWMLSFGSFVASSQDPFQLTVEGDLLYGRGTTDCLGSGMCSLNEYLGIWLFP